MVMTLLYGMLVKDQNTLDLAWNSTPSGIYPLAERVLAIQDAIETLGLLTIDSVAKESTDPLFRRVVKAIRQGVINGETWCAGYTTRALLAETFSKTPDYFQALRYFCDRLRLTKQRHPDHTD